MNPRLLDKLEDLRRIIIPFQIPITEKISKGFSWLEQVFLNEIPNYGGIIPVDQRLPEKGIYRIPFDRAIQLVSLDWLQRIILWDWVDAKKYYTQTFDCEDFAFLFKARTALYFRITIALMIDYSGGHAYNILILPEGKCLIFEPQNDQIIGIPERFRFGDIYKMEFGFILI